MKITRKLVMGVGSMVIALGLLTVLDATPAFAKKAASPGSVTCTGVTGSITFKPPLTSAGGATSESAKVAIKLSSCTATGTGAKTPTKGTVKSTISTTSNSCTSLASPNPTLTETFAIKWAPGTISSSTTTFGPFTAITSPNVGFSLTGGVTTGSYAGTSGTATAMSSLSTSTLGAACAAKSGLKTLKITSGTMTVG